MTIRDNVRIIPNAVAKPSRRITGRANPCPGGACGAPEIRNASQINSRSCAAARTNGLSVPYATGRKYSEVRSVGRAPLPNKYLYFIFGARLRRRRSAESDATLPARVPGPHIWADINESDVPSDGTSLPRPNTSSRPDVFARAKCTCTRNNALRNSTNGSRRKSYIHWRATKISLRANAGMCLFLYSSMTASRRFTESDAP